MSELTLPAPPPRPRFGAAMATAILVLQFAAQGSVAILVATGGLVVTKSFRLEQPKHRKESVFSSWPLAEPYASLASASVTVKIAFA